MSKAVIFDVGRVLLDWDVYALYRKLLPSDAEIDRFLEEVRLLDHNLEFDRGKPFTDGIADLVVQFPHRRELLEAFDERWHETIPGQIEGSVAILDVLHAADVPLFAITNFAKEKWALAVERFPFLATRFRDVAVSGHEGIIKPDAEIFTRLLVRNALQPDASIFIDDSPKNIEGARAVGIDAVLFVDPDTLRRDLADRGVPGMVRE